MPARLVPDNLKTGVDRPDLYDPKINRAYAELAAHYGTLVDPARALKPKDKPQVERPMPYVRDSFWRGREFASLEAMRADAVAWCSEVAGQPGVSPAGRGGPGRGVRRGRGGSAGPVAGGAVRAGHLVEREDRPGHPRQGRRHPLLAAVALPRRTRRRPRPRPPWCSSSATEQLIKTHPVKERGKQTDYGDYPPEKIAFHLRTPTWCRTPGRRGRPGLRAA